MNVRAGLMRRSSVLVVLAFVAVACGGSDTLDVGTVEDAEAPPADAELVEIQGWPETAAWIERETEAGRPVVVNLFASWCVPCRREIPLLLDAADDHPDIAFLGIDHQDQRDNGERFVADEGIDYPTLYDPAGHVAVAIESRGMPTTAFFDADGRLVETHTGELTESRLADSLDQLTP